MTLTNNAEEKRKYRIQIAISVVLLFMLGAILNIPFSRELKRLRIENGQANISLNSSLLDDFTTIGISSFILGSILAFIGLWLSSKTNLGAPIIARFFSKKPIKQLVNKTHILSSLTLSIAVAVLLLGLFEIQKELYPVLDKLPRPAKPFYAIVSVSAGISEEIMFRLGLMSLIIAGIQFFKKLENPTPSIVWTGILISSIFFGLIHLPLSKNFVELTPFTIGVTMIGNLMTGSTFGWIFWKRGLIIAILSHITFDLMFHVVGSPYN